MHNIIPIKGWAVTCYMIVNGEEVVLIDGGFVGDLKRIEKALTKAGKNFTNLRHILLTHGHLDHTYNIKELVNRSGAKVWGSVLEKEHIMGKYPYKGSAKVCGFLEVLGRTAFGYSSFELDELIEDGQQIPVGGGFQAIHLPGHTAGHFGYLHQPTNILFIGDLFENSWKRVDKSPFFLNTCPEHFPESFRKVINANPSGIYPNHCDKGSPEKHLEELKEYVKKRY